MLFLNRRGDAGFVSCRSCGLVLKCPHCDVALSEHNNGMLSAITAVTKRLKYKAVLPADRLILVDSRQEPSN